MGKVSIKMTRSLAPLHEQMSKPKYAIATGSCTITGMFGIVFEVLFGVWINGDVYLHGNNMFLKIKS